MFKNDLVFGVHEKQVQVRDEILCFVGETVKCYVRRSVDLYICVHQCKQKRSIPSHRTLGQSVRQVLDKTCIPYTTLI